MQKGVKIAIGVSVAIIAICAIGGIMIGKSIGNALTDDAEYDYEVTNSGTNQISTGSGSLFTHTAQSGYKYVVMKVVAKTIDADNGINFTYSDFKLKCADGNSYPYAYGLSKSPSGSVMNGYTCTLSIAYEIPSSTSPSSITADSFGIKFKHNDSLIGGSGGSSSSSDGTYYISSKTVKDYLDSYPATVMADRDYAVVYITVTNNTSSSMSYISQFSLVTTGGQSYTPLTSYSSDYGYSSSKTISAGSSATYGLVYQVPTGLSTSQIASVNYTGGTYSLTYSG